VNARDVFKTQPAEMVFLVVRYVLKFPHSHIKIRKFRRQSRDKKAGGFPHIK
jgi:hypothetical protein